MRNPDADLHGRLEVRRNFDGEVLVRRDPRLDQLRVVCALVCDISKDFLDFLFCAMSAATGPEADRDSNLVRAAQRHLSVMIMSEQPPGYTRYSFGDERRVRIGGDIRTGRSTLTVMLSPGATVVHSAGAPMRIRCATAKAAEASRHAAAMMSFMALDSK